MTAPSPKEALEPFAKAADNYADCTDDGKFIDDDATVTVGNLRDARFALATLQPSGERREAIARIIDPVAFAGMGFLVGDRQKMALSKADLILASDLLTRSHEMDQAPLAALSQPSPKKMREGTDDRR